jgi:hypothetical protein
LFPSPFAASSPSAGTKANGRKQTQKAQKNNGRRVGLAHEPTPQLRTLIPRFLCLLRFLWRSLSAHFYLCPFAFFICGNSPRISLLNKQKKCGRHLPQIRRMDTDERQDIKAADVRLLDCPIGYT